MCGIGGIYAYSDSAPSVDKRELFATRERMTSRGPDGSGTWMDPQGRIALAHRRLAIIELTEAGAQPMVSNTGNYVITFNGEIYNYQAIRAKLIEAGYTFSSHSDTEVLLHLYDQKGPDMLLDLRGMFTLGIWDVRRHELFLARDTYGIKPLYYSSEGGTFRFASLVKALLAGGAVSRDADHAGEAGFYLTGSVPEPFTIYKAIRALPAGCWMKVDADGPRRPIEFQTVAQLFEHAEETALSEAAEALHERARAALLDSVRSHLVADVPVGAFLSAGVDSGALVGLMRDAGAEHIQTLTLSFAEFQGRVDDEAPLAAKVAQFYGTQHTTRTVTAAEFRKDLAAILEAMDQPSIDGVNSWFASKAVHEVGMKVAISGLGGDELLGGYPSFKDVPKWHRRLGLISAVPGIGPGSRQLARTFFGRRGSITPKAFSLLEYGGKLSPGYFLRRGLFMPWELKGIMGDDAANDGLGRLRPLNHVQRRLSPALRTDYAKIATLESSLYMRDQLLRDTDWASMAHSLEVRVPLVDVELTRAIAPMMIRAGAHQGKMLLSAAPSHHLPPEVIGRKKTGFGIPVGSWKGLTPGPASKNLAYGHSRHWAIELARTCFSHDAS